MGMTALVALIVALGLVLPVNAGRIVDACLACALAVCALLAAAGPQGRADMRHALGRHWLAAFAFCGLLAWFVAQASRAADPAAAWSRGELSFLVFAALGLGALATAAAARRQGAAEAVNVFLAAGIAAGVLTLLTTTLTQATPPAPTGLAGLSVLAAFAGLEAYRRAHRAATDSGEPAPLARRLFLPVAACVACAVGMAAARDGAAVLSAGVGVAITTLVYMARLRRSQQQPVAVLAFGFTGVAALLYGLVRLFAAPNVEAASAAAPVGDAGGAALSLWHAQPLYGLGLEALSAYPLAAAPAGVRLLAESGLVGVGVVIAAATAGVLTIALTSDRQRLPSRGGALCAGVVACAGVSALTAPGLAEAAPAAVFACLLGLSAAYGDRRRASSPVSALPPQSAGVGMQRL